MKLAITFWGTQKYIEFLPEWYERLEQHFVPDVEKHYFVFTDGDLKVVQITLLRWKFLTMDFQQPITKPLKK
jgi:hypothetical protein